MLGLALATKKYLFGITCLVEKPLHMAEWQAILFSPGMLEGGRQGGQLPPQILADQKAPQGSGGTLHFYLPPQIFRLCNMPDYTLPADMFGGSACFM